VPGIDGSVDKSVDPAYPSLNSDASDDPAL
jgi:hypothetical protein